MTGFLDSMILELGLEIKGFEDKVRTVDDKLEKTRDNVKKTKEEIHKTGEASVAAMDVVGKGAEGTAKHLKTAGDASVKSLKEIGDEAQHTAKHVENLHDKQAKHAKAREDEHRHERDHRERNEREIEGHTKLISSFVNSAMERVGGLIAGFASADALIRGFGEATNRAVNVINTSGITGTDPHMIEVLRGAAASVNGEPDKAESFLRGFTQNAAAVRYGQGSSAFINATAQAGVDMNADPKEVMMQAATTFSRNIAQASDKKQAIQNNTLVAGAMGIEDPAIIAALMKGPEAVAAMFKAGEEHATKVEDYNNQLVKSATALREMTESSDRLKTAFYAMLAPAVTIAAGKATGLMDKVSSAQDKHEQAEAKGDHSTMSPYLKMALVGLGTAALVAIAATGVGALAEMGAGAAVAGGAAAAGGTAAAAGTAVAAGEAAAGTGWLASFGSTFFALALKRIGSMLASKLTLWGAGLFAAYETAEHLPEAEHKKENKKDEPANDNGLLRLIHKGETGHADGDAAYSAINLGQKYGYASTHNSSLTRMTFDEVVERQKNKHFLAVGAYQFTQGLAGYKKLLGLSGDELFDKNLQDRLAIADISMKRPQIAAYISGKGDKGSALRALANEWASFEDPDNRGHSRIRPDINHPRVTVAQAGAALDAMRKGGGAAMLASSGNAYVTALQQNTAAMKSFFANANTLHGGTTQVTINTMNINTKATDAKGIAKDIKGSLKTFSLATTANSGQRS